MKIPDGTPGQSAEAAAESAAAASESAAHAHESADLAMEAAVKAAVAAAVGPLQAEIERLKTDEVTDDAQTTTLSNLISSLQSQLLWVTSGAFLLGAAVSYFLMKVFE